MNVPRFHQRYISKLKMNTKFYPLKLYEDPKKWKMNPRRKRIRRIKRLKLPQACLKIFQKMILNLHKVRHLLNCDTSIISMLNKIIPNEYFGTWKNRKLFYFVVKRMTTQTQHECIFKSFLRNNYNIECMKWLNEHKKPIRRNLLLEVNMHILDYIVKPLIRHIYVAVEMPKSYEIKFIPKKDWILYKEKIFKILLEKNHLIKTDFGKFRGQLKVFPKDDLNTINYRPIIYANKTEKVTRATYKKLSEKLNYIASNYSKVEFKSLFSYWENVTKKSGKKVVHGIILDIKDAFGNVDVQILCDVINKSDDLTSNDKLFLTNHIQNALIMFKKKVFKWNHGILQGDHMSAALCNLYISFMEHRHLSCFKNKLSFFRVVDDYLYCTTEELDIINFESELNKIFPLNQWKTQRASGLPTEKSTDLNFNGYIIDFKTLEMGKKYKGGHIRHRFKFWNKNKIKKFSTLSLDKLQTKLIKIGVTYTVTYHCFTKENMNFIYNSEKTVLTNYFKGMIYAAYRFNSAVRSYAIKSTSKNLHTIVEKIVIYHTKKMFVILRSNKNISFSLLRNIAFRAFVLVLKTNFKFYRPVLEIIDCSRNTYLPFGNLINIAHVFTEIPLDFPKVLVNRTSRI